MLHIRLFGGLEVVGGGGERLTLPTRSSRHLLAFLALNEGRSFQRDRLAGTLWGERTDRSARKVLRNDLWRLQRALERRGDETPIRAEGQRVGMLGHAWTDTQEFRSMLQAVRTGEHEALTTAEVHALERTVALYRGDLLEDVYEEWASSRREELRLAFLAGLERLFSHHAATGDLHAAVVSGRRLLRHNPFLEHVHRGLMLCHYEMGDRPLAVRQYERCRRVLRDELDLDPMKETRELHERIVRGTPPALRDHPSGPRQRSAHAS